MGLTRPTGRTPNEIVEVPPAVLDCGHRYGPRLVTLGYESPTPEARRVRTYRCRECGTVTFTR